MRLARWRTVLLLSLTGLGLSTYLTAVTLLTLNVGYCGASASLSCESVLRSEYARIGTLPVAAVGAAGFGTLFAVAYGALVRGTGPSVAGLGLLLALGGLGVGLYLTYLELFVIGALCLLCFASFLLVLPVVALTAWELRDARAPA